VVNVLREVVSAFPLIVNQQACSLRHDLAGAEGLESTCVRWSESLLELSPSPRKASLPSLRARFLRGDARPEDFEALTVALTTKA